MVFFFFHEARSAGAGRRKRRASLHVDAKETRYRKIGFRSFLRGSLTERGAKLVSMHNDSSAYH